MARDPFIAGLHREPGSLVTRSRSEILDNAIYYKALVVNEYLRPAKIGHRLGSMYKSGSHPRISNFHLHRESGEKDFSERDRQLLDLFHMELGRLIGRSLVSATEPGPEGLSPRLRQTLGYLLEGESEKQIASRLGLSRATTHLCHRSISSFWYPYSLSVARALHQAYQSAVGQLHSIPRVVSEF